MAHRRPIKLILFLAVLSACVTPTPAPGQVTFQANYTAGTLTSSGSLASPTITAVNDALYVVFVTTLVSNQTSITTDESNLVFTKRQAIGANPEQCNRDNSVFAAVYTARGTPSANFVATANYPTSGQASMSVLVYTGVAAASFWEDTAGQNNIGENDITCSGGSNSSNVNVTTTANQTGSVHISLASTGQRTVTAINSGDTQRSVNLAGGSVNQYVFDFVGAVGSDHTLDVDLNAGTKWIGLAGVAGLGETSGGDSGRFGSITNNGLRVFEGSAFSR
jgi:hypothetical protein